MLSSSRPDRAALAGIVVDATVAHALGTLRACHALIVTHRSHTEEPDFGRSLRFSLADQRPYLA